MRRSQMFARCVDPWLIPLLTRPGHAFRQRAFIHPRITDAVKLGPQGLEGSTSDVQGEQPCYKPLMSHRFFSCLCYRASPTPPPPPPSTSRMGDHPNPPKEVLPTLKRATKKKAGQHSAQDHQPKKRKRPRLPCSVNSFVCGACKQARVSTR